MRLQPLAFLLLLAAACRAGEPTATLTAAASAVPVNGSTKLTWTSTGASHCFLESGTGTAFTAVSCNGSQSTGKLSQSTWFHFVAQALNCMGGDGQLCTVVRKVLVSVGPGTLPVTVTNCGTTARGNLCQIKIQHPTSYPNPWEDIIITAALTAPSSTVQTLQ